MKRFPIITTALSALALLIGFWDGGASLTGLLEWDRSAIADGQWWRVATGHLCHWSSSHMGWDLVMFAVLGGILERTDRRALCATLALTVVFSQIALVEVSGFETYRGLSGFASALFAGLACRAIGDGKDRMVKLLGWVGLLGFGAKLGWEITQGGAFFVNGLGSGVKVAYNVHVAGFAAGIAAIFSSRIWAKVGSDRRADRGQVVCPAHKGSVAAK